HRVLGRLRTAGPRAGSTHPERVRGPAQEEQVEARGRLRRGRCLVQLDLDPGCQRTDDRLGDRPGVAEDRLVDDPCRGHVSPPPPGTRALSTMTGPGAGGGESKVPTRSSPRSRTVLLLLSRA